MQKNKILLASLISLFSINASASAWMPNSNWLPCKDKAMIYAVGGLAVTSAFLLHKVYKLSERLNAQADAIDTKADATITVDQKTTLDLAMGVIDRQFNRLETTVSKIQSEFDQHKAITTTQSQTHDNTAALLMKRLADLEENRTKQLAELEQTKKALSILAASPLEDKAKAEIVKDVTARVLTLEQDLRCFRSTHGASEVSLSLLKTELERASTKEELNKQIKELKDQLANLVTAQALETATKTFKSEAATATRAAQKAQDELREVQSDVVAIGKRLDANAPSKTEAENTTTASASATATTAKPAANA